MSNIKRNLMKEIEAKVARKKQLATQISYEKTVAKLVAEFFIEYDKVRKLEAGTIYSGLSHYAVNRLNDQLRRIDNGCNVYFSRESDPPTIEIQWSTAFIAANSCEEALVFDASSALFQSAMEEI